MSAPVTSSAIRVRAITAYLAVSAGLVAFASLEFMLEAIQDDFSMTPDETIVVGQISSGASLFAVFLAGALADRIGDRRVLATSSLLAGLGAVVVGLAPDDRVLLVGLCLSGIGTIAMSVSGLSVLDRTYPDRRMRARAFGLFAVVAPAVSIVVPLVVAVMIPMLGWRSVVVLWIAVAGATFVLARRSVPPHVVVVDRAELVTPALAGVALAGIALTVSFVNTKARTDQHSVSAVISLCIGLAAIGVIVPVMRRMRRPTLDLRMLRSRGSVPIFLVVIAVNGVNLFFFTYLMLQYRYHQSLFDTAVFLVVPQMIAAGGAVLGGHLGARWGSAPVALAMLAMAAVCSLGALLVTAGSSAWVPVLVLSVAAAPIAAAVGPVTQSFMEMAPGDGVAATSSLRTTAANLGVAIIGVVSATIVFDDLDADTARDLQAYRDQADAFHLAGAICFAAYLTATVLVAVHVRRRSVSVSAPGRSGSADPPDGGAADRMPPVRLSPPSPQETP